MKKIVLIFILFQFQSAQADWVQGTAGFVQFKIPETKQQLDNGISTRVFCGGVKIGKLQYLTASHCTEEILPNFGKLKVGNEVFIDGVRSLITSIKYPQNTLEIAKREIECIKNIGCIGPENPNWIDIAIVKVSAENSIPIASINSNINITQEFIVSGNEFTSETGAIKSAAKATIAQARAVSGSLLLDPDNGIYVNLGDSGSPVWALANDGTVELIGITSKMTNSAGKSLSFIFINNIFKELGIH